MKIQSHLANLGLPEKEATIYGALLKGGKLSLTGLSRISKINQTTLYLHIRSLLSKKVIRQTVVGKRTYYSPENPEKVIGSLKKKVTNSEKALPDLMELYTKVRSEPGVNIFQGKDAFKRGLAEVMKANSLLVRSFWSPRMYYSVFSRHNEDAFVDLLKHEGLKAKVLMENASESTSYIKYHADSSVAQYKMLSRGYEDLGISLTQANDKIAFMSYLDEFVLVIQNKVMAHFIETIHRNLWDQH